jgi:hypothetical protein
MKDFEREGPYTSMFASIQKHTNTSRSTATIPRNMENAVNTHVTEALHDPNHRT